MRSFLRTVTADIWRGLVLALRHPVRSATDVLDELGRVWW
jgi:hypothetical protein